jgi:hypothetical protein
LKRPDTTLDRGTRLQIGDLALQPMATTDTHELNPLSVGEPLLSETVAEVSPRRLISLGGHGDLRAETAAGAATLWAWDGIGVVRRPTHRLSAIEADPRRIAHRIPPVNEHRADEGNPVRDVCGHHTCGSSRT